MFYAVACRMTSSIKRYVNLPAGFNIICWLFSMGLTRTWLI